MVQDLEQGFALASFLQQMPAQVERLLKMRQQPSQARPPGMTDTL